MRTAELTANPATNQIPGAMAGADDANRELLSALAGKQAGRERAVAENTRRVVRTSLGVMQEQKAGRRRTRSLALASILVALLALGPVVWHVTDDLIGGEHISDIATQVSILAGVLCAAILAAVVVAGRTGNRS